MTSGHLPVHGSDTLSNGFYHIDRHPVARLLVQLVVGVQVDDLVDAVICSTLQPEALPGRQPADTTIPKHAVSIFRCESEHGIPWGA